MWLVRPKRASRRVARDGRMNDSLRSEPSSCRKVDSARISLVCVWCAYVHQVFELLRGISKLRLF